MRYDQVNVMLLNEFLKDHKKVETQQAQIEDLETIAARQEGIIVRQQEGLAKRQVQIDALTSGLESLSAQNEINGSGSKKIVDDASCKNRER